MWLAYIIVFWNHKPLLNIFCVIAQALMMITVIGLVEPMIEKTENRMQLFNEFFFLLLSYHLLPLTDFVLNIDTRNFVANGLIIVTLSNLAANILVSMT